MNKADLRKQYKFKRSELSSFDIKLLSEKIFNQITSHFDLRDKTIHVFIPIEKFNEIDTTSFVQLLFKSGCTVATSITHFNPLYLSHCIIDEGTVYETDKFGIPTPIGALSIEENKIDVVIVPLLAFDMNGGRVGYGKGLYDRFLSKCKSDCIKIGVSFFEPIKSVSDIEQSDVLLDYCCTPERLYRFHGA